ncbi:MAG: hypothetical protein LKF75_00060 [Bacilli bacterium]|jgi:hypothetical protein|nr:hypothetical protein [Bacilli bacterium]MCH4210527.1 hypothetical protein [Bacilli bacterium]MCH4228096.1 hypothetical protein [Bacilli bacterium]MCH4278177.1 hypothetical protein [Bacilli bacterium]MCI2054598.1 hypothetical protein [Bacilli bacterium]
MNKILITVNELDWGNFGFWCALILAVVVLFFGVLVFLAFHKPRQGKKN